MMESGGPGSPRRKYGWGLSTRQPHLWVSAKKKNFQGLWTLLMQICAELELRREIKCTSATRPTEEIHQMRSLRWRESVDVKQLLLGAGPSLGFVGICEPILWMNSSAWEKGSRLGLLNKAILPLLGWRQAPLNAQKHGPSLVNRVDFTDGINLKDVKMPSTLMDGPDPKKQRAVR